MNLLCEALDLLLSERFDAGEDLGGPPFKDVYDAIRSAVTNSEVGLERNGFDTNEWIAGVFINNRGSTGGKFTTLIHKMEAGELQNVEGPEGKPYRDAVRAKAAFEVLHRYRLVGKERDSESKLIRYIFPASKGGEKMDRARAILSQYRQTLTAGFHHDNDNDLTKNAPEILRVGNEQAHGDWANDLPPEKKQFLKAYTEMNLSTFNMLQRLNMLKGRDTVARYRSEVQGSEFKMDNDLSILQHLGFVTGPKNLFNHTMAQKFFDFLADPRGNGTSPGPSLRPYNAKLTQLADRSNANVALANNDRAKPAQHLEDPDTM